LPDRLTNVTKNIRRRAARTRTNTLHRLISFLELLVAVSSPQRNRRSIPTPYFDELAETRSTRQILDLLEWTSLLV